MLSQAELKKQVHYDPMTGAFTWAVLKPGVRVGDAIGTVTRFGYLSVTLNGKKYQAHRLAWLYVYGTQPPDRIDHKNTDRLNNRIANLRAATNTQNMQNSGRNHANTSGFKGVDWHKSKRKWRATAKHEGRSKHLGYFETPELASVAYVCFAKQHHGEFFNAHI